MKIKRQAIVYECYLVAGRFLVRSRKDIEAFTKHDCDFPFASQGSYFFLDRKEAERFSGIAEAHLTFAHASVKGLHFIEGRDFTFKEKTAKKK